MEIGFVFVVQVKEGEVFVISCLRLQLSQFSGHPFKFGKLPLGGAETGYVMSCTQWPTSILYTANMTRSQNVVLTSAPRQIFGIVRCRCHGPFTPRYRRPESSRVEKVSRLGFVRIAYCEKYSSDLTRPPCDTTFTNKTSQIFLAL